MKHFFIYLKSSVQIGKEHMKKQMDYTLYLCTDRALMSTQTLEEAVTKAIEGGCTLVQLREKNCSSKEFYEYALSVKGVTDHYGVPLIINDRVDIALAVEAEGIHVGQSDLPISIIRKIVGNNMCIGSSVATLEEALKAEKDGADYLGIGAMYATGTKQDTRNVSMELLKEIRNQISIPIVAIGGININNVGNFKEIGIDGVAVISAIIAQKDIVGAARKMREAYENSSNNSRE